MALREMRARAMNEFSRDELINIYEALMDTETPVFENLPSKVSLMIDNYCEHTPDNVSHSICPLGTDMIYKCKLCGEFYR